ncbi:hypothetical protein L0669_05555 [Flavobacterium bizetiae]|uniref:hypothetical protein n=1 Tax=Flavobacterium bizetiae TaxID=2704140 RepID=UPI0021E8A322|nr:hypothetical protein [Flavobacterium bizetiae]UTN05375.1 hypothetical protein L0669_05555 [Flavobacterium bizetiae]
MAKIQRIMDDDDITYLKKYIERNLKNKDGGHWEYIVRPEIRDVINALSETDSERFSKEIFNWNEKTIYPLADEIIFGDNKYIDQDYLYCCIFLRTHDKEKLDYLSENLFATFNLINVEKTSLEFFLQMKEKIKNIYSIKDENENEDFFIKPLNDIINEKMKMIKK